jgi:hypothetical protein
VSFFGILILNVEAIVRLFKEVFAMWWINQVWLRAVVEFLSITLTQISLLGLLLTFISTNVNYIHNAVVFHLIPMENSLNAVWSVTTVVMNFFSDGLLAVMRIRGVCTLISIHLSLESSQVAVARAIRCFNPVSLLNVLRILWVSNRM